MRTTTYAEDNVRIVLTTYDDHYLSALQQMIASYVLSYLFLVPSSKISEERIEFDIKDFCCVMTSGAVRWALGLEE